MTRGRSTEKKIVYLDQYPFDKCDNACFLYGNSIAWNTINEEIKRNMSASFDVSDCIDLFEHLQLDENYVLVCYVAEEFHGRWGRVAAIPKNKQETAKQEMEKTITGGYRLILPEVAAPPMEAIYNDGTPEGYLEAILCKQFLSDLPYHHNLYNFPNRILICQPKDLVKKWNIAIDIPDWRPRMVYDEDKGSLHDGREACTIIAFSRKYTAPIEASDGKDTIMLNEYIFPKTLWFYRHLKLLKKDLTDMYRAEVEGNARYKEGKCCCVPEHSVIQIAKEK